MTMKQSIAIRHLLSWLYTGDKNAKNIKYLTFGGKNNVQTVKVDHIRDEFLSGDLDKYSPKSYKLQLVFAFLEDLVDNTDEEIFVDSDGI